MTPIVIHTDCRHYRTDHPCKPHKETGVTCERCSVYDRVDTRVLVVKLDAIGDVLRTTSILAPLKAKYPKSEVTWLTDPASTALLDNNAYVDQVVAAGADALLLLLTKPFDVVINPDASIDSSRYATLAKAKERFGFELDADGKLIPLNDAAQTWYLMGLHDTRKRENTRTYQDIILEVCELPPVEHPIIWTLSRREQEFARDFAARHGLVAGVTPIVGLNTGAGGRWKWKKWTIDGYRHLIRLLLAEQPEARVLLYGGAEEQSRNAELSRLAEGRVIDTGGDNSLRDFGALISLCDVMVTGDTLGLHVATALGKKIVALFGPTSAHEIELYGRGHKILPEKMDCLCCYLSDCDVRPACMERIKAETVFAAVKSHFLTTEPK